MQMPMTATPCRAIAPLQALQQCIDDGYPPILPIVAGTARVGMLSSSSIARMHGACDSAALKIRLSIAPRMVTFAVSPLPPRVGCRDQRNFAACGESFGKRRLARAGRPVDDNSGINILPTVFCFHETPTDPARMPRPRSANSDMPARSQESRIRVLEEGNSRSGAAAVVVCHEASSSVKASAFACIRKLCEKRGTLDVFAVEGKNFDDKISCEISLCSEHARTWANLEV